MDISSADVTSYDRCSLEWFGGESSLFRNVYIEGHDSQK